MKRIPIKAILIVYMTPLLMATDCSCNCQDESYEIQYTGVEITAWDTSKFHNKLAEGEVSKNAFGINIHVEYEQNEIALQQPQKKTSFASFGIAYAWSCDCYYNYSFPDPIMSIFITATDNVSQNEVDVTDAFIMTRYGGDSYTVSEVLEQYKTAEEAYIHWEFDLVNTTVIPDEATFTVTITLDSGKTLTHESEFVTFID